MGFKFNPATGTLDIAGTGGQTTIVGITGTKAQFNTAVTDGDIAYLNSANTFTSAQLINLDNTAALEVRGVTGSATAGDIVVDTTNKTLYIGRQSSTSADNTNTIWRNRTGTNMLQIDATPQMLFGSGTNIAFNSTTGTKIGTATTQKFAFHNATAVVQRAGANQAAVSTTASTNITPYGFTTSAQADAIVTLVNEIRAALVEKGLIKGSS